MNDLSIMQKFADPALFDTLSFSEKSIGALITTLMGMGITFSVLILLWGLIVLMAKLTAEKPKPPKVNQEEGPAKTATATNAAAATITNASSTLGISPELIAVISAAIESFEGKTANAGNLIIRKISRATGQATSWGNAGNSEAIASRKF
ncbi:MAG: OadG family protein [Peptostreptococcaceae bacterium]|nr:OadG family protein [Peptostreptococcaceae bacterium]